MKLLASCKKLSFHSISIPHNEEDVLPLLLPFLSPGIMQGSILRAVSVLPSLSLSPGHQKSLKVTNLEASDIVLLLGSVPPSLLSSATEVALWYEDHSGGSWEHHRYPRSSTTRNQ